ncbi:MAG TPA: hypothetical protein VGN72_12930 [Tepidisphaeraceae bacterium]|nr:hypothetical protein [Tepidisphaeraceae bacterium]
MHTLIGELLGKQVELSAHDVEEILQEQGATGRRFGDIALSWGLCQPQHVWRAWAKQHVEDGKKVDLSRLPVDCQAVTLLPYEMANRLSMIPLRSFDDEVIIAAAELDVMSTGEVGQIIQKTCRFVRADSTQIREAIATYYHHA